MKVALFSVGNKKRIFVGSGATAAPWNTKLQSNKAWVQNASHYACVWDLNLMGREHFSKMGKTKWSIILDTVHPILFPFFLFQQVI